MSSIQPIYFDAAFRESIEESRRKQTTHREEETCRKYNNDADAMTAVAKDKTDLQEAALEFTRRFRFRSVIDIGCGVGDNIKHWTKLGITCVGIDKAPRLIERARELTPNGHFYVMDMTELTFGEGSFDAFFSSLALVHVAREKAPLAFAGFYRILKPGGVGCILTDTAPPGFVAVLQEDVIHTIWNAEELKLSLQKSGFDVLQIAPCLQGVQSERGRAVIPTLLTYVRKPQTP